MTQDMKDLARRYVEAYNEQDFATLDAILAPDFVDHDPLMPGLPPGRDGEKVFAQHVLAAFPDLHGMIEDIVAEDDRVVTRITWSGTQQGEFSGVPASGKRFSITEIHLMKGADGRIAEDWTGFDQLGLLQQLGALPTGNAGDRQEVSA